MTTREPGAKKIIFIGMTWIYSFFHEPLHESLAPQRAGIMLHHAILQRKFLFDSPRTLCLDKAHNPQADNFIELLGEARK